MAPIPGSVRAIGILNLVLSLVTPMHPVGIVAAIGLLRARAWGRALTLFWGATTLLALVLGGIRYVQAPIPLDTIRRMVPGLPAEKFLLSGAVLGAALALYLLIVLSQSDSLGFVRNRR